MPQLVAELLLGVVLGDAFSDRRPAPEVKAREQDAVAARVGRFVRRLELVDLGLGRACTERRVGGAQELHGDGPLEDGGLGLHVLREQR